MASILESRWTPRFQSLASRTWILASFYTAIFLALPFWLKTTTIERLPLPRADVVSWEAQLPCPLRLQQSLTLLVPSGLVRKEDQFGVAEGIRWGLRAAGDGIVENRRPRQHYVQSERKEDVNSNSTTQQREQALQYAACLDWDVRVGSKEERRVVPGLHYEIELLSDSNPYTPSISTPTLRRFQLPLPSSLRHRHNLGSEEVSSILSSYLSRIFQLPYTELFYPENASMKMIANSELNYSCEEDIWRSIEQREEDRRRIPYTRNLRLIFSLINEDIAASPSDANEMGGKQLSGVRGWDKEEVEMLFTRRVDPLLKALSGSQIFHKELQTTWFAPLQFEPKFLEVERELEPSESTSPSSSSLLQTLEKTSDTEIDKDIGQEEHGKHGKQEEQEQKEEREVVSLSELSPSTETSALQDLSSEVDRIHLIDWEDINIFVNSGEWSLTSGAVTSPESSSPPQGSSTGDAELLSLFQESERTLHFIVYVPKPEHRPLRIAGDEHATSISNAKGWLIPQWGGVSLMNLGHEEESRLSNSRTEGKMLASLTATQLDEAFATFEKQLFTLLGIQDLHVQGIPHDINLALKIDALTRRRTIAAARESVKTLGSIIRLVDKIENLGVGQSVRDDVSKALALLDEAKTLMRTTSFDTHTPLTDLSPLRPLMALLYLAHSSEVLSSRAFFNPNMLGQLYFPDEHKYAVYTPLFGPLAVPLLVAGLRLVKERRASKGSGAAMKLGKAQ